ncbi:MAG: hypothetical protein Kow0092_16520 [Deferrisomatales bacterium]
MDYDAFLRAACPALDLQWRKYRRRSARRRVQARIAELGLTGFEAYLERLASDPEEARRFPDRARVTVSRFFRERDRWEALFARVVPQLVAARGEEGPFRVWSAGCCNGEEPYTFAILWAERIAPAHPRMALEVIATDIDPEVLARARAGRYPEGALREVPVDLRRRWFSRRGREWAIHPRVARPVAFRVHHLLDDPPPRADLALCRYLAFTYYRGARRQAAARRLWEALPPGGALVIGRKEGLGPAEERWFEPWPGAPGVFRRRARPVTGRDEATSEAGARST